MKKLRLLLLVPLFCLNLLGLALAEVDTSPLTQNIVLDASLDRVWQSFSTDEGLKTWMAPLVKIDLKVGGSIRSNYNPEGNLQDKTTIVNTILAYDPKRMLTLKVSQSPDGFPFKEAAAKTWSVFYFSELPGEKTLVTLVGLGYDSTPESQDMRTFFEKNNPKALDALKEALKKP